MRTSVLTLALVLAVGCKAATREAAANNPVTWTLQPVTTVRAGAVTAVGLAASIDKGWYIYSITQKTGGPTPMTVTVAPSPPFSISGNVTSPAPVVVFDKEFNMNTERYEGAPSFIVPVTSDFTGGAVAPSVEVKVRFQACNETMCLPAHTVALTSRAQIAAR